MWASEHAPGVNVNPDVQVPDVQLPDVQINVQIEDKKGHDFDRKPHE